MNATIAGKVRPVSGRAKFVALLTVIYTAVGAGFSLAHYGYTLGSTRPPTAAFLLEPFLYWYLCALLTPFLFWVIKRYPPSIDNVRATVLRYVGAVVVASIAHEAVMLPSSVLLFPHLRQHLGWVVVSLTIKGAYFFCGIMIAAFALQYYRAVHESQLRRVNLEASLSRAQYQILNNQIRPHFLFNTLNAMAALSQENPPATKRMTQLLSDFLRRASEKRTTQKVPFRDELRLLGLYVDIMRVRFSESLTIRISVPPELMNALVPQFLLQPLVENAIKYAIDSDGRMQVTVTAWCEDNNIAIRVADRGPSALSARPLGTGLGMTNLRGRLAHLYSDASCAIQNRSDDRGVEVLVRMPYEECAYEATA